MTLSSRACPPRLHDTHANYDRDLVKREGYGNAKVWFGRWCVKKEDEWCEESVWITFKIN